MGKHLGMELLAVMLNVMFNFIKNCELVVFQCGCSILCYHQPCRKIQFLHIFAKPGVVGPSHFNIQMQSRSISLWFMFLCSLITNVNHSFGILFVKYQYKYFVYFLIGCMPFKLYYIYGHNIYSYRCDYICEEYMW